MKRVSASTISSCACRWSGAKIPNASRNLYIDTENGQRIPLSYVADIRQATGPNTILREDTRRRFVVSINPTVDDLNRRCRAAAGGEVAANVALPEGYSIAFEGEYLAQQEAKRSHPHRMALIVFLVSSAISFTCTFQQLQLCRPRPDQHSRLPHRRRSLHEKSNSTTSASPPSSVSSPSAGIAARNQIMMISHYLHLMRHEGESFSLDMVIRGTLERLVPVLMTALSAGIALIPLILAADEPGKEILNPVAVVIVGGLFSSTLLGLALTPAIFYHFCRKPAERAVTRNVPACG